MPLIINKVCGLVIRISHQTLYVAIKKQIECISLNRFYQNIGNTRLPFFFHSSISFDEKPYHLYMIKIISYVYIVDVESPITSSCVYFFSEFESP